MLMKQGTPEERHASYKLASVVKCDPRTALKWLRGDPVRPVVAYAMKMAAAQLGIEGPVAR